jgi:hypothetical protein
MKPVDRSDATNENIPKYLHARTHRLPKEGQGQGRLRGEIDIKVFEHMSISGLTLRLRAEGGLLMLLSTPGQHANGVLSVSGGVETR